MGYPLHRGLGYHDSVQESTLGDVAEEILRAREKFPTNKHLLAALMEEVGELSEALLKYGGEDRDTDPLILRKRIRDEAIQVAATAIRIIEEGDSDFAFA